MVHVIRARGSVAWSGGADLFDQLAARAQAVELEVAQDEVEIGRGGGAAHLVDVDEPLATGGRFRRQRDVRQRVDDLGRQVQGVDQLVLRLAWMDRDPLHVDVGLVRGERLVDDLAQLRAVQRVRDVGLQVRWQIAMDATADLLVRREADPDRPVRQCQDSAAGAWPSS